MNSTITQRRTNHKASVTWTIVFMFASILAISVFSGCDGDSEAANNTRKDLLAAVVKRQDVVVEVSATGTIEPIRVIEIKSKASGEILHLPVETGDTVKRGALLVQIDTTDVAAEVRQQTADLAAQRARFRIAQRQADRARDLFASGMISQDDLDQAQLDYTNAQSNLIRTETELQRAQDRFSDTVVRAPSDGTIISKSVEVGQIIASATSQVSGGTTLMTMADLSRVQIRSLIDETDIGKIKAGQNVTVRVDAIPNRILRGQILKVEPQGLVERDITFFPVIVEIDNEERLLLPSMNAGVDIHIDRRANVLALTNDAVKTTQQAFSIAPMLNIDPDTIRSLLASTAGVDTTKRDFGEDALPPPGSGMGLGLGMGGGPGGSSGGRVSRNNRPAADMTRAVVFVADSLRYRPVVIQMGIQNWEVTEVLSGLREGDTVVIPPSPLIAQQFQEFRDRMQARSGLPGLSR